MNDKAKEEMDKIETEALKDKSLPPNNFRYIMFLLLAYKKKVKAKGVNISSSTKKLAMSVAGIKSGMVRLSGHQERSHWLAFYLANLVPDRDYDQTLVNAALAATTVGFFDRARRLQELSGISELLKIKLATNAKT